MEKLKTFTDVNALNKRQLKGICEKHRLSTDHSKSALVILVCHQLGISTTGKQQLLAPRIKQHGLSSTQLQEYSQINLAWVHSVGGETKNLDSCPDIDDATAKKYLLDCDILTSEMSRKYKLSRPYQLKEMIHSVNFNELKESTNFMIALAKCNPSQSTSEDDIKSLFCIFNKRTGAPIGGFCSCTAGHSQSCGHIGALLFVLADIISSGEAKLPADATCTDLPCYWAAPKGAAIVAKKADDILVTQKQSGKFRRTSSSYGQFLSATFKPPNAQDIQLLRGDLITASQSLGIRLPAIAALHSSRFGQSAKGIAPVHLEDRLDSLDASLAPAAVIDLCTSPTLPLAVHPHFKTITIDYENKQDRQELMSSLSFTTDECHMIETTTRGQSSNIEWFQQRMGVITSTQASDISRTYLDGSKASRVRLANKCLGQEYSRMKKPPCVTVDSLKYGRDNEENARSAFQNDMSKSHLSFRVEQQGMIVKPDKPYLRGSPDGISRCSCHSPRLLEIKCPFSARDQTVDTAVNEKKIDYLLHDGQSYKLHRHKRGYFCQIQMIMALLGLSLCELVVWTKKQYIIVNVEFDPSYWSRVESVLDEFYRDYVLITILCGPLSDDTCQLVQSIPDQSQKQIQAMISCQSQCKETATPKPEKVKKPEVLDKPSNITQKPKMKKMKIFSEKQSHTVMCHNRRCRKEMNVNEAVRCTCHCSCNRSSCISCCNNLIDNVLLWTCNVCKKQCN